MNIQEEYALYQTLNIGILGIMVCACNVACNNVARALSKKMHMIQIHNKYCFRTYHHPLAVLKQVSL